jgi:hypothetical protein
VGKLKTSIAELALCQSSRLTFGNPAAVAFWVFLGLSCPTRWELSNGSKPRFLSWLSCSLAKLLISHLCCHELCTDLPRIPLTFAGFLTSSPRCGHSHRPGVHSFLADWSASCTVPLAAYHGWLFGLFGVQTLKMAPIKPSWSHLTGNIHIWLVPEASLHRWSSALEPEHIMFVYFWSCIMLNFLNHMQIQYINIDKYKYR